MCRLPNSGATQRGRRHARSVQRYCSSNEQLRQIRLAPAECSIMSGALPTNKASGGESTPRRTRSCGCPSGQAGNNMFLCTRSEVDPPVHGGSHREFRSARRGVDRQCRVLCTRSEVDPPVHGGSHREFRSARRGVDRQCRAPCRWTRAGQRSATRAGRPDGCSWDLRAVAWQRHGAHCS